MILFLVARGHAEAVSEASRRGWVRVGYGRWATPEKADVRLVTRFSEMPAIPGARLVRGWGEDGHPEADLFAAEAENSGGWVE